MTDINEKNMVPENEMEEGKQRSAELARLAIGALEDKKAEDVRVIDIGGVSVLADYFIIASGNNRAQVQAMADEVEQRMGRAGAAPRQIEGYQEELNQGLGIFMMDNQDIPFNEHASGAYPGSRPFAQSSFVRSRVGAVRRTQTRYL